MHLSAGIRYEVAIVRVEAGDAQLRIELLEVGHGRGQDRVLGRATNAADACRMLDDWLGTLATGIDKRPFATDDGATDR